MLEIKDLNVYYGGIHALKGIDIEVGEKSIVTLIGANGAGKSTCLRSIMGLEKYSKGEISYLGSDMKNKKTREMVKEGISLVPEGRRIFPNLSVRENLILGSYCRKDKEVEKDLEWIYGLFPRLRERMDQMAGTMSGGEQQMLAVGRALMSRPKLLMMDEPSLGLAPLIVKDIFNIIRKVHREMDMSILLIEQNAKAALEIADYAYVLETGKIVLQGKGKELLNDEKVKKAYLGESA